MIKKILIANRGEIALRVIRTCRDMGIKSVAIYSEADKDSLHVKFANEAVCIGPSKSSESYLNIPRIIAAAEITNSDAIHPGYGFLAENQNFAEICIDSKINFIGPLPEMIRAMGEKSFAKETMRAANVPVIPGSDGVVNSPEEAKAIANNIGYPVMLKAAAGGGGKGMRIVQDEESIESLFNMARNEALAAFGNGDIYLEKVITNSRHIEVQILGDKYGNVTHFFERDCSIQRRHQKLIEEAPSSAFGDEFREKICTAGVQAAKAVNYLGAGTVEFLVDKTGNFYFMEMNTRLQVEHPVTEQITGIDLVREQINVANGQKLKPRKLKLLGHSIECRINAEDPDNNFQPSAGVITAFNAPNGLGIRLDSHCYDGYVIPHYYDSLIGKLIAYGKDRREAIARMARALEEFVIEGVKSTVPFHEKMMQNERFNKNNYDTRFLDTAEI
jgi:acetyl-CoA carboxylase biotin carboxylase subunit